jgi:hypothetical protein
MSKENERLVERLLRAAGWDVTSPPGQGADLIAERGKRRYVCEVKFTSQARRDRLEPSLAVAILQARTYAKEASGAPLAIMGAPHISDAAADGLLRFAHRYAPDVAIGIVDLEGFSRFRGDGLEGLDSAPREREVKTPLSPPSQNLFSDLNQWMLKVLLAPRLPSHLLRAPRGEYRNASELARAAEVSVMSAFRFQQQLIAQGFLDNRSASLRLVRLPELFRQWQAAYMRPPLDLPMRWWKPGRHVLREELRKYEARRREHPRSCLGLFAAADALGLGFVHGVPPHVYLERVSPRIVRDIGLEPAGGSPADVFVRLARPRASLMRGAVEVDGQLVSDVIQIWLDVANYPARGAEQAEQIRRTSLAELVPA